MPTVADVQIKGVELDPNNEEHCTQCAMECVKADDFITARRILVRTIGLFPNASNVRLLLAQVLLAQGEYEAGWREYEHRITVKDSKDQMPPLTSMAWNGMKLHDGARIFLLGDQGFGDAIQFSRFIPQVAERCSEVIVGCSEALAPLVRKMPGVTQAASNWKDIPGHTAHSRLGSLPGLLNCTLDNIPPPAPIHVDFGAGFNWAQRLDALPQGTKRVGLVWAGRPEHPNDARRSLPLRRLLSLPEATGQKVSYVSLQRDIPADDACLLPNFPGLRTFDAANLRDFTDTAALIQNLDLVVTVDTSVAHLAASMGKPTWILTAKPADFRWLLGRTDSPWYPSARLFRQEVNGEWGAPVTALTEALKDYAIH